MPCLHKFRHYLDLENLNFLPTTLIIGTFNPSWPTDNYAQWFYGRTDNNNFWNVLPRIYNEESLINANVERWKSFCRRQLIAITDLISCIEDADFALDQHNNWLKDYSDKNIAEKFQRHSFIEIVQLLQNNPSIKNVYLTRGIGDTFWRRKWIPVRNYCNQKNIHCEELLTPSGFAFYQQGRHNKLYPENQLNLSDFIFAKWKDKWHDVQIVELIS
jgi:hypothetical protein